MYSRVLSHSLQVWIILCIHVFSEATEMTWRTSFPSWWLASSMHCPDLSCLPRCFTSVSSLAVESFTASCTFLLSLSRAELWPFWRALGSPSQWLTGCSAPLSDCRVPWVCVYLMQLISGLWKQNGTWGDCSRVWARNVNYQQTMIFQHVSIFVYQLKFYLDLLDIKKKPNIIFLYV